MKFAIIGVAGYVAPKHLTSILETNNELVAALDPHDSVGILDRYFPNCKFFTEYERFDRYLEKLKSDNIGVDYISICSPNYLHDAHCRLAMRIGANAICEKPIVLNSWNIDQLLKIEKSTNKKVYVILQLRYHPYLKTMKEKIKDKYYDADIRYITPRGPWYHTSWKGDVSKSGGLATNIGIHLFDLVLWYFGRENKIEIIEKEYDKIKGILYLEKAKVNFYLSTDRSDLKNEKISSRYITIDNEIIKFDNMFNDLHTLVYKDILEGGGMSLEDARPSIELVQKIRGM